MLLLLSAPGGSEWILVLAGIALIIAVPIVCYVSGFRNGKREGERLQLQRQVDSNRK